LVPPNGKPASIAPSLQRIKRGVGTNGHSWADANGTEAMNGALIAPYPFATEGEPENPTVVPADMLARFHFTFLIRDPHSSIPSYFRCTIPPLDKVTGFYEFYPSEAGFDEVRRVFDYLRKIGHVGPRLNGKVIDSVHTQVNGFNPDGVDICVVDADDLLDNPAGIIEAYCKSVGIRYEPEMLSWDSEEHQTYAKTAFEKWKGFHEDAILSKELKARTQVSVLFRPTASLDARGFTKSLTHLLIMTEEARQDRV
jgi:Sulfotransferase domain